MTDETSPEDESGEFFDNRCPKRREAARKAADTRAYDDVPTRRNMTFRQRLSDGFEMLSDDPPDDYYDE